MTQTAQDETTSEVRAMELERSKRADRIIHSHTLCEHGRGTNSRPDV